MIKWIRPSGSVIETKDTEIAIAYAKANNWKRAGSDKPKPKKKKG